MTIKINYNRNIALERSVIYYWEALTGLRVHNPRPML